MTKKVINRGVHIKNKVDGKTKICPRCGCYFTYEDTDVVKQIGVQYVQCPNSTCNHPITVRNNNSDTIYG